MEREGNDHAGNRRALRAIEPGNCQGVGVADVPVRGACAPIAAGVGRCSIFTLCLIAGYGVDYINLIPTRARRPTRSREGVAVLCTHGGRWMADWLAGSERFFARGAPVLPLCGARSFARPKGPQSVVIQKGWASTLYRRTNGIKPRRAGETIRRRFLKITHEAERDGDALVWDAFLRDCGRRGWQRDRSG